MSNRTETYTSSTLLAKLAAFPAAKRYMVGFSGGADSTALLFALNEQREKIHARIEACHFNHGLNEDADAWQQHCKQLCQRLEIPFHNHRLSLSADMPNLESTARDLRYEWVAGQLDSETLYLTAHHADDRAETLLLNALRGSGLDGVSSIPEIRPLGAGHVVRPLLDFSREALVQYLKRHELEWIEDPSNQDSGQDRNFIRNEVIPLLETRWPAARRSLARTAGHLGSANSLLKQLIDQEFERSGDLSGSENRLPYGTLSALGPQSAGLVLRQWLSRHRVPESRLLEFLDQLAKADSESKCELAWESCSLRLYRGELLLSEPADFRTCPELEWQGGAKLDLGVELGSIRITGSAPVIGTGWRIGPRRSDAAIRLHAGGPGRKLKKVLQEQLIPPWQRMSVPILYRDDEILAIGDWTFSHEFGEWLTRHNLEYHWRPDRRELLDTRMRCHALDPC